MVSRVDSYSMLMQILASPLFTARVKHVSGINFIYCTYTVNDIQTILSCMHQKCTAK